MAVQRFANAVFCDDVRPEILNKYSQMGIYSDRLLVTSFPTTLPKFCIVISAQTDISSPFKQLGFRVLKGKDVLVQVDIDEKRLQPDPNQMPAAIEGEDLVFRATGILQVAPLLLTEPCVLFARATTEDGELKAGALVVDAMVPRPSGN